MLVESYPASTVLELCCAVEPTVGLGGDTTGPGGKGWPLLQLGQKATRQSSRSPGPSSWAAKGFSSSFIFPTFKTADHRALKSSAPPRFSDLVFWFFFYLSELYPSCAPLASLELSTDVLFHLFNKIPYSFNPQKSLPLFSCNI